MIETILQKIGAGIATVALAVAGLFGAQAPAPAPVGATIPTVVAVFQSSLQSSITSSDTSMTLVSGTDAAGTSLSGYTCFNIDEGTSLEEFVCGTATGTSITSMLRGIDPRDGDLEVTALKKTHRRGATVKITTYPILGVLARVVNGSETFPNKLSYTTHPSFSNATEIIDKQYADNLAILGAGDADTTTQGLVEIPTQAEVDAGTDVGGSGAHLVVTPDLQRGRAYNDYAVDAVGTDSYAITITPAITAYAAGQVFTFKAGTANTGAATLNVSGLGAKTIKKEVSLDLATGDILANQDVLVVYDGTNMQLISNINSTTTTPVTTAYSTASVPIGDGTTRFDITNPAGTTFRYTYDGTGTDPTINGTTFPVGAIVEIDNDVGFNAGNRGSDAEHPLIKAVTGSGTNYFEITNASGVAENNVIIDTSGGYIVVSSQTWTKPAGLKYIEVEIVGGGGGGGALGVDEDNSKPGGGAGGYSKKRIATASLGATESIIIGQKGIGGSSPNSGTNGKPSIFGLHFRAIGGGGADDDIGGNGGLGFSGDINAQGAPGQGSNSDGLPSGAGGSSYFGGGALGVDPDSDGADAGPYGAGGSGGAANGSHPGFGGGDGSNGVVIITEYY